MTSNTAPLSQAPSSDEPEISLAELLQPLQQGKRWLIGVPVLATALGWGLSFLIQPTFTAVTTFLPPQQQQSGAASALASLGALAGLGGGAVKTPADQYVALMQSVTVSDRMVDRFKLMAQYEVKYRELARKKLSDNVQIVVGKKDGLISISVDDPSPDQAAAMANQYVEELRRMTSLLAVSEAQQRRVFFEKQLESSKLKLAEAQSALQDSGFNPGALKTEPKSAAEAYARLRAELTAAEVKLQTLRGTLADASPEVQQQLATIGAIRAKLAEQQQSEQSTSPKNADYVSRYREFKYQETLFDLMAKQYEIARSDESREGALIQVVDPATPPERRSKPRRSVFGIGAGLLALLVTASVLTVRGLRRRPPAPR